MNVGVGKRGEGSGGGRIRGGLQLHKLDFSVKYEASSFG